jgi:hypothetical protein
MAAVEKLDLIKHFKEDYSKPKHPKRIQASEGQYLAIEGEGPPGSESFGEKVNALYSAAYTMKFASKDAGKDFVVCKLENLSWVPGHEDYDLGEAPMEAWHWRLMIRMPEFIGKRDLVSATQVIASKGETPGLDDLELFSLDEGECIQMLHVGPYEEEGASVGRMREYAAKEGLVTSGPHHEIYLSDPRRIEPARLKTILRMPVRPL